MLASISLKEEREKRQQINTRKNLTWSCFSLPLHPTHFEAAVRRMSKIQSVLFLYTFLSSISFFPSGSDGNQCLMAHLRYSKTTWKERESKDRSQKKRGRKEGNWCLCVCVSRRGGVCLLAEDCADVHAAAGLTHHSACLKKKGFSPPLCFKYHRPSKWAPACLQNK